MAKVEAGTAPFIDFDHVGIMVRDIEKVMAFYSSLGVVGEWSWWGPAFTEVREYGELVDGTTYKPQVRLAPMGNILIELIQPGEPHSLWQKFIERHGDGLQHIGFKSNDIDRDEAMLVARGVKVPWRCRWIDGGGATYFLTDEPGGMLLELIQRPAKVIHT
jgi:methylmalonyl-CoA/ethylmalonyl-CoA epimerase